MEGAVRSDEGLVGEEWNIKYEDMLMEEGIGEGSFGKGIVLHYCDFC